MWRAGGRRGDLLAVGRGLVAESLDAEHAPNMPSARRRLRFTSSGTFPPCPPDERQPLGRGEGTRYSCATSALALAKSTRDVPGSDKCAHCLGKRGCDRGQRDGRGCRHSRLPDIDVERHPVSALHLEATSPARTSAPGAIASRRGFVWTGPQGHPPPACGP